MEKKHKECEYLLEEKVMGERITARIQRLDEGMHVLITGGVKSHIGAISYIYPGQPVCTIQFPGHKDGVVSEEWACELHRLLGETVCVECGIHYDNLKKEEIEKVVEISKKMLANVVRNIIHMRT